MNCLSNLGKALIQRASEWLMERSIRMEWQPIETAPNHEEILVWYDDGTWLKLEAEDNDCDFGPYKKPEQVRGFKIAAPQYWCRVPSPSPPKP